MALTVKNPPAMGETWVQSLGWEDPLEEGMATHSSNLAWRNPMDRGAWWATVDGVAKELNFSIFEITLHSGNKSYLVILYFIKSGIDCFC